MLSDEKMSNLQLSTLDVDHSVRNQELFFASLRANIPRHAKNPFCWDLPENVRVQNAILLYHPLQAEVGMVRGQRARTQAWMIFG